MVEHAPAMQQAVGSIPAEVWRLLTVIRFGPYKQVTGSQQLEHKLHMLLLHATPSGEVASRCNPRHKGACNPNSSQDSVSIARISASVKVCVGAARNPWTCEDFGIELSIMGNSL